MRTTPAVLTLFALLAAFASAQEPSAKDLRTLLHADVKQYAFDDHLVAKWPFKKSDEMNGFVINEPGRLRVVDGQGLEFAATDKAQAVVLFKEVEFQQPSSISFELRLDQPESGFAMTMMDSGRPEERMEIGMHMLGARASTTRYEVIGHLKNGAAAGSPKFAESAIPVGTWTQITVDLKKDRLSLVVGKSESCGADVAYKRFVAGLVAVSGKSTIRNLSVDSQVNRDSIRKLFRSVAVAAASRPKSTTADALGATAWKKIAQEFGEVDVNDTTAEAIDALPADAQKAVEAGLESMHKSEMKRALDNFEAALKAAPASAIVMWLAGAAARDASLEKAVRYLEKAVATDPKLEQAWGELGEVCGDRGDFKRASEAFDKAEALDPADPFVHVQRARFELEQGNLPGARKSLDRALKKRPDSAGLKLLSKSFERLAARPDWKDPFKKETPQYIVETTISSKCAADLAQKLVVYRRFLETAFPLPLKQQPPPSRVWIFDSEDEYHQFANSLATGMDGTVGLYHKLIKTLLLTSKVSAETTQHILYHEGFHQYLDLAVHHAPIWMNEGFAEYFGATTFDINGKATEGGIVSMRLPSLQGPIVPIEKLMLMSPGAFMSPKLAGLHYAESWALVHYFKRGGNTSATKLFDFYCTAVIAGKSQTEAFALSFARDDGTELKAIEKDFRNYIRSQLLGGK